MYVVLVTFIVMLLYHTDSTSVLVGVEMSCTDVFCMPLLRLES